MDRGRGLSVGGVIYIILGVLVANSHGYFVSLITLGQLLSALLAILLWPLLFFGIDVHLGL